MSPTGSWDAACHTSKQSEHFYEETDDDYCMIMEDDARCFYIASIWNFHMARVLLWTVSHMTGTVLQLTTITTGDIYVKLHHEVC